MQKKKRFKKKNTIAVALVLGICSSQIAYASKITKTDYYDVRASPWYYATITVPTSASDWWTTTTRDKTRIYPGTAVDSPVYPVVSTIFRGNTTTNIGTPTVHATKVDSIAWHSVASSETSMRGAFRNQFTNPLNNQINLRWSP